MVRAYEKIFYPAELKVAPISFQETLVTLRTPAYAVQDSKIIFLRYRHCVIHLKLYICILCQIPFFSP